MSSPIGSGSSNVNPTREAVIDGLNGAEKRLAAAHAEARTIWSGGDLERLRRIAATAAEAAAEVERWAALARAMPPSERAVPWQLEPHLRAEFATNGARENLARLREHLAFVEDNIASAAEYERRRAASLADVEAAMR